MKLTEYFQLTIEERIARERARKLLQGEVKPKAITYTLDDYYAIEDCVDSLTRLRDYQWRDFLGRYKIF